LTLSPVACDIACRNGSQFFFWLTEASVEITPKLISGVCAPAATAEATIVKAAAAQVRTARIIAILLSVTRCLERDDFSSNRHPALAYWWSMIFSENRYPLFGIML
jgi:hypothetical protein